MKTARELLSHYEWYAKAVANAAIMTWPDRMFSSPSEAVYRAFDWESSPEGLTFWMHIVYELENGEQ